MLGFLKFWKKDEKGDSFDKQLLDMDFFCQLSYMAAIATSGIARSGLFQYASKLPYISARYFKKVIVVAKAFNHDYSEACRIVGETTKEPEAKALLLRLSGALASGEDTATFLERESEVFSNSYGNRYERCLEVLKKWTDAYVALIMTSALVTVMAVVSMILGNINAGFIMAVSMLTIVITIMGAWLIYHSAPREIKTHSLSHRSKEQALLRKLLRFILPMGGIMAVGLLMMKVELGWVMLAAGICIFPIGLISLIDDRKINKRDMEIAGFLRSLGGISQAIGATITEAMSRIDFRSMGSLKDDANLLYNRLTAGMSPSLCWMRFVGETGSEQVNRSVRIFWDGVALGGEPERVGHDASLFAVKISLLRASRGVISSGFSWLSVIMHFVLTALIVLIFQILITFSELIETVTFEGESAQDMVAIPSIGVFSITSAGLNQLHFMIIVIILVLSFANAFAIYSTRGSDKYVFAFYLAIMLVISGLSMAFVPPVLDMMFSGIT